MQHVRQPVVAGTFYPAEPEVLRSMIQGFLKEAEAAGRQGAPPKAVIAPHAGYVYSGPVAASAFHRLATGRGRLRRIVLLGPSHRVAFRGLALPKAQGFATPLGVVPVDTDALKGLQALPWVREYDDAHAHEHSLEVELPFLQMVLEAFSLVPLVVGDAEAEEVEAALDRLWDGEETAIVVSSDLSHYLDYDAARSRDRATSEAIRHLDAGALDGEGACGFFPVRGFLGAARRRSLKAEILDLRNSGDTAGGHDRVVGYGAYAFL